MKRSIYLLLVFGFFFNQLSFAQSAKKKPQPKVPAVVTEAFTAKYPAMKVTKWDWEAQKETYEAKFMDGEKKREATFSPDGKWVKTKTDITQAELPAAVAKGASAGDLSAWTMIDFSQVESPDKGTYYKIRFKKGAEEKSLKFDANGNQLGKTHGKDKKPEKS